MRILSFVFLFHPCFTARIRFSMLLDIIVFLSASRFIDRISFVGAQSFW